MVQNPRRQPQKTKNHPFFPKEFSHNYYIGKFSTKQQNYGLSPRATYCCDSNTIHLQYSNTLETQSNVDRNIQCDRSSKNCDIWRDVTARVGMAFGEGDCTIDNEYQGDLLQSQELQVGLLPQISRPGKQYITNENFFPEGLSFTPSLKEPNGKHVW